MTTDLQTVSAATSSSATTGVTATAEEGASPAISSDFETFLLMLTTQLQNQDPLNPMESQEFAVQLATFSGVEQQVQTNQLLQDLVGSLGGSGLSELAGWVGMEGRVFAPVAFDGAPVDLAIAPDPGADTAELIVRDAFGGEVAREGVPLSGDVLEWAGTGSDGNPLPPGQYTIELASYSQGETLSIQPVAHYARIEEARQGDLGVEVVTAGGAVLLAEDVSALREPKSE